MPSPVGFLRTTAFRKGVRGASRGWFAVWAGLTLAKWVHEHLLRDEEVVERFEIAPGQRLEVRDTGIRREEFDG